MLNAGRLTNAFNFIRKTPSHHRSQAVGSLMTRNNSDRSRPEIEPAALHQAEMEAALRTSASFSVAKLTAPADA
jgi:hypothetical protein